MPDTIDLSLNDRENHADLDFVAAANQISCHLMQRKTGSNSKRASLKKHSNKANMIKPLGSST